MLGRDFAGTSANIGLGAMQKAALKPNEPNLGVMLANGIKAYDNNQKKQAYVDALQGGDQDAINKAWADYDADGYAQYLQNKEATQTDFANKLAMLDKENEYAIGLAKLRAGLGNPSDYGTTPIGLALAIDKHPEGFSKAAQNWSANYLANGDPDSLYTAAYNKEKGKGDAKSAIEALVNQGKYNNQLQNIQDTIDFVSNAPDELFTPVSPIYNKAGALSGNKLGFNSDEQAMYGTAETLIQNVKKDLVEEARSKGQTGINTMDEIENAALGLNMNKGRQTVLGALKTLEKIKQKLDTMPTVVTPMPQGLGAIAQQQNNNLQTMSDDDLLRGL